MEPSNTSGMYNLRYGCHRGGNSATEKDTLSGNTKKNQTESKTIVKTTLKTTDNQDERTVSETIDIDKNPKPNWKQSWILHSKPPKQQPLVKL